jgi:perosamine synthetase
MIPGPKIELDAPSVGELEKAYLGKAIDQGFVSAYGPFVPEFERRVAELVGAKSAVSTQSGTAAPHLAQHRLGLEPGNEVIVPALSFIASGNPLKYVGAMPMPYGEQPSHSLCALLGPTRPNSCPSITMR